MASVRIATNEIVSLDWEGEDAYSTTWVVYVDNKIVASGAEGWRLPAERAAVYAAMQAMGIELSFCHMNSVPDVALDDDDWD